MGLRKIAFALAILISFAAQADGVPQAGDLVFKCDRVNGDDNNRIHVYFDSSYVLAGNYGIQVSPEEVELLASDSQEPYRIEVNGSSNYLVINKTENGTSAVAVNKEYASAQQFRNCEVIYRK